MTKILLIQGANLNYLGKREPEIYGLTTAAELDHLVKAKAQALGLELEVFYTNIEGEAINRIYQAVEEGCDALIMNPGGFTHAGYALKECISGTRLPYIEVHLTNLAKRKVHSVLAEAATAVIYGLGVKSYLLALEAISFSLVTT